MTSPEREAALAREIAELRKTVEEEKHIRECRDKAESERIYRVLCGRQGHQWKAEDNWRRFESCTRCGAYRRNF